MEKITVRIVQRRITRKRFMKLLMSAGASKRDAEVTAKMAWIMGYSYKDLAAIWFPDKALRVGAENGKRN